jgi:hypothetical protein
MLHVIRFSLQNIILNAGDLKLDVVFQGFYGEGFIPVPSLLQAAPKIEIWRCPVWRSKGLQSRHVVPIMQWSNDPCSKNKCHSASSVEATESYSCIVPA